MIRISLAALILTVTFQLRVIAETQTGNSTSAASEEQSKSANFRSPGIRSSDGSKIYTGRFRAFDFQEMELTNVFRIIAEVSNLNIILMEPLEGRVNLTQLADRDWESLLAIVLEKHQLAKVRQGNVIKIYRKSNPILSKPLSPIQFRGHLISVDLQESELSNALKIIGSSN